jgi:two-component system heavy metal sensor histidine kinase CusS
VRPLSIRLQLSLATSLLTLVIITVLSVAAYIDFEESLLSNIDATLQYMGEVILAELVEQGVSPENREAAFRAITGHGTTEYAGRCRVWMDGSQMDVFASDPPGTPSAQGLLHPPADKRPDLGSPSLFNIPGSAESGRRNRLRAMWMRRALPEGNVNILVTRSINYAYHELGEFLRLLLVLGGSITLIALFLTPKIISWGLRPITQAGGRLEQITHRSFGHEEPVMGEVPMELRPFKSALDAMLSRLNKAMRQQEQFTADAAHELRTPLAIMKSTLQILHMQPRTAAEYEQAADDVLQDVDRMEQLVNQLLTLARLDAMDRVPDPVEVRLDMLLGSLAEVFGSRAGRQGASVVYTGDGAVSIEGDETELQRLFSNLLDNALRYGPPKGTIHIILQDGPGPCATVCVHDEGGNIPPEKLPRLFDRFYRVDSSRSQASGGAGLGLAIAREIVLRQHGDITMTSDPQAGTSVIVRLPRQ